MSELAWAGSEGAAQLLAWAAAYGVAIYSYRRSAQSGEQRFILALWASVVFAHLGWALLHLSEVIASPQLMLHPGAVSVLFIPLGILIIAPWREALAALPLALAVSRLGCLPYTCCYAELHHALPELGALLLLHFAARKWPEHTTPIVLSGLGLVRLVSTPLRTEPHTSLFIDPLWIAGLWIVAGVALRSRIGSVDHAREWFTERTQPLLRSLLLTAIVWALFQAAAVFIQDHSVATLCACFAATIVVAGLKSWRPWQLAGALPAILLGLLAGVSAFAVAASGLEYFGTSREGALGMPLDPISFASVAIFAPIFQELLYRERILGQLRELWGAGWAVLLSSALFALSHLEVDVMFVAFAGGLVAGVVWLRTRSLPLVIGMHAGWNASVLMRAGALGMSVVALSGCASENSERRPTPVDAKVSKADSDNYLRYVAFELPFGDAVLLRWNERQMPLKIFLPPPPDGLFSDPESYQSAVREGVVGWSDVAGPGLPRFEFVDAIGDADIPITWAREPQADWYIAQTVMNVVPSQRRFDVAQLLVTARWQDGRIAPASDVRRVVLHEMGHALGFAGHSLDPGDIMYATVSATELSARDRATLSALYARPVGARVTGAKGSRLR